MDSFVQNGDEMEYREMDPLIILIPLKNDIPYCIIILRLFLEVKHERKYHQTE